MVGGTELVVGKANWIRSNYMVLCAIGQVQNVIEPRVGVIELVVGIGELVKE